MDKTLEEIEEENRLQAESIQLAQLTMLERIYDANMAMLGKMDPELHDRVWLTHERGGAFNPPIIRTAAPVEEVEEIKTHWDGTPVE